MLSRATVSLNEEAAWSNGEPFEGSLLLLYVLPELGTGNYPHAVVNGADREVEAPYQVELPLRGGVLDPTNPKVFRTDGITPPSAKVLDFWIDRTGALIATGASLQTIVAATKVFTVPDLDVPSAETDFPQLGGLNRGEVQNLIAAGITQMTRQVLTGTGTEFVLSREPDLEVVYYNGQILVSPEDYSLVGTALTLTFTKEADDVLEVLLLG